MASPARMDGEPNLSNSDELLAHSAWMRRLAIALAGADGADDLMQETWLRALAARPVSLTSPRAWLARVMQNLARTRSRDGSRRRAREEESARSEELPSAAELAAEAELSRMAAGLALDLDEPFRSTLLLRYVRDLEPAEIARLQGVPASTVRNRLRRGLERVRAELDARHSGRRHAWMGIALGLGRDLEPIEAAAVGGALMNVSWIAGAALVVGAAAWLLTDRGTQPAATDFAIAEGRESIVTPVLESQPEGGDETAEREPLALQPSSLEPPTAIDAHDGRVVDPSGAPVAGARVWMADVLRIGDDYTAIGEPARTDAHGRFDFEGQHLDATWLFAEKPGFQPGSVDVDGRPLVIELWPAATIEGVVLDADSGDPLPGTHLSFGDASWRDGALRPVVADANGRFRFAAGDPNEAIFVSAIAPGRIGTSVLLDPPPGELRTVAVRIGSGQRLFGHVVDVESGASIPQADARVDGRVVAQSDDRGRFELRGFGRDAALVEIVHPDYATTARFLRLDESADAIFPLVARCTLAGTIRAANGTPVVGAEVVLLHDRSGGRLPASFPAAVEVADETAFDRLLTVHSTRTDTTGRYRFERLSPFMAYRDLQVRFESARVRNGPFAFVGPGAEQTIDVDLPRLDGRVSGTVTLDARPSQALVRWQSPTAGGQTYAAEDGTFTLEHVELGPVTLEVRTFDPVAGLERALDVPSSGRELGVLALQSLGGQVAGVVVSQSGAPVVRTVLRARTHQSEWAIRTTEDDGSFDLGLDWPMGTEIELEVLNHKIWFPQPETRVGAADLRLTVPDAGALRVRVANEGGSDIAFDVSYRLTAHGQEDAWHDQLGSWSKDRGAGVFELELPATTLDLLFRARSDSETTMMLEAVEVPREPGAPLFVTLR